MLDLQIFLSEEFGKIRVVERNREPWFVVKDVCDILGIANPSQALSRLEADEKDTVILNEGIGNPEKSIINEYGLYSLVLSSRKPEAKAFKRWVTREVIPAIRKHGGYLTPEKVEDALTDPDTIIKLATRLKEERAARAKAEQKLEAVKPKVLFADAVSSSQTSILVGDLAKLLKQNGHDIGTRRLFQWLRENGYLMKRGAEYNSPTQRAMEMGLFELKESVVIQGRRNFINKTAKVTGRGQLYFINLFAKKGAL